MTPDLTSGFFLLLAVLCLLPVLIMGFLVVLPFKNVAEPKIVTGNPLFNPEETPGRPEVFLKPMTHSMRTANDAELHGLVLGLRHVSLHQSAPILKRALHRPDPKLQIYAQSILQQKQELLQNNFARLATTGAFSSAASIANFLEAGLLLLSSPLTQSSERALLLGKMLPDALQVITSAVNHPRLLATTIEFCLHSKMPEEAGALLKRLPVNSPLQQSCQRLVAHHMAVHHPAASAAPSYEIH